MKYLILLTPLLLFSMNAEARSQLDQYKCGASLVQSVTYATGSITQEMALYICGRYTDAEINCALDLSDRYNGALRITQALEPCSGKPYDSRKASERKCN